MLPISVYWNLNVIKGLAFFNFLKSINFSSGEFTWINLLVPHYVKNVCIWSFSGPYFPAFRSVSLGIQSKCGKIQTRKTPNTDSFHAVLVQHDTLDLYETDMLHVLSYIANSEQFDIIYILGQHCLTTVLRIYFFWGFHDAINNNSQLMLSFVISAKNKYAFSYLVNIIGRPVYPLCIYFNGFASFVTNLFRPVFFHTEF